MALFRKAGRVGSSFKNNKELQKFVLTDVTPTGRCLGVGSYGSVEEVIYQHLPCAGKKLHEALLDVQNEGVPGMVQKYLEECQLMSSLRHPNVTQFLGICFLPGTQRPLLVMEQLETSLDDLLEHMPHLPISLKCSFLEDVTSGLLYLHKRNPPVIHRDLTAKNILLTAHLAAKITDMGNSRIVDMEPGRLAQTLSKLPGTLVYMPPEALDDRHSYGPPLDVFSFGHLALFTVLQTFPGDLLPSTYPHPDNLSEVRGRTELERRGKYIAELEAAGRFIPSGIVQLIKQSLQNAPDKRPSTEELLTRLQRMRSEMEGTQGGNPMNLDIMVRVRMAKEMKMKDRQIEELTEQKDVARNELEEKGRELNKKDREFEDLQKGFQEKEAQLMKQLKDNDDEISRLKAELSKSNTSPKEATLKTPDEPTMPLPLYVAKFDYVRKKDEELALTKGDLLHVIKVEGTDWWCAQSCKTGKTGFIPSNYVTLHENSTLEKFESSDPPMPEGHEAWEIARTEMRLTRQLGSGEFGTVWASLWKEKVEAAVKTFRSDKISISKLFKEVMKISELYSHPNLVRVYGVCSIGEPIYLVTELMKESLVDYLRGDGRALKLPQLIYIAAHVAAGMAHLEINNYVHQNLAARNILVGKNGVYKVADYGLIRAINTTVVAIKWVAPETAAYGRFSIKSDVWSFGILLTEIITHGRNPYPGMNNSQVLEALKKGYRMPCPKGCPLKLHDMMLDCWKEDPNSRLTFETLKWQLEEIVTVE